MRNVEITVIGLVQGVGFRPFVAEAARELSISGMVWNAGGVVKLRAASSDDEALEQLLRRLSSCQLPGARVDEIRVEYAGDDFSTSSALQIVESEAAEDEVRFLPADIATCDQCERELLEPGNRRYRYPFISCVSCGPRFTIMTEVPYDRERTTMKDFLMCAECGEEYTREGDIRRYAQTIACEACGPEVSLFTSPDEVNPVTGDDAVRGAVSLLKSGRIVAVKDIGGYHFCFDPDNEQAAVRLREFKNRERKPFAVMFPDMESIRRYCLVSAAEERLLSTPARPIVLIDKRKGIDFAPSVCGNSRQIGAMLPCNPLQILLLKECGPLVMTSGNRGGEPIITDDEVMLGLPDLPERTTDSELGRLCVPDAVLSHNREILNGLDDSIYQVTEIDGEEYIQILRRARGIVPEPVRLPIELSEDVFAAGGDLKAVFALGRKDQAYLSGHFGDLDDSRAFYARKKGAESMERLLGITPELFICDKHPGYRSAAGLDEPVRVQHHYAHILSVIAEHGLQGRVLGVAFDGTGYGDDGTIWGSEFLLCEAGDYHRAGHFSAIPMTGGDASAVDARLSLFAYLCEAERRGLLSRAEIAELFQHQKKINNMDEYLTVSAAIGAKVNTVVSSSMGRLFDAVSALLGICSANSYEGECACMLQAAAEERLEQVSTEYDKSAPADIMSYMPELWFPVKKGYEIDSVYLVAQMVKHFNYGEEAGKLSLDFHMSLADATSELCSLIGCETVALSGGTMCNRLLLKRLFTSLKKKGMRVYINEAVPTGDGGIALGQIMYLNIVGGVLKKTE